MSMLAVALDIQALGYAIFPLAARSKQPAIPKSEGGHGCLDATTDLALIYTWWEQYPQANVGIATGPVSGLWVLDVDMHDGERGMESLHALQQQHAPLPDTRIAFTPNGGLHYYWAWDESRPVRGRTGKLAADLDTRGRGGYVVAPGSVLDEGEYAWVMDKPVIAAPGWLMTLVVDAPPAPAARPAAPAMHTPDEVRARDALKRLAAWRVDDYEAWVNVGMSLATLGLTGLSLWDEWSHTSAKYKSGECERKWRSFDPNQAGHKTLASLFFWANQDDPKPAPRRRINRGDYRDIIANGL